MDITESLGHKLSELYCSLCKNYLSVPPVRIDINGNNICGRCESDVGANLLIHNIHYENLACNFMFPCRYASDGCSAKKSFHEVKAHEEMCPYEIIKCKVNECVWRGTMPELIIHYKVNHDDLLITNGIAKQLPGNDGCFLNVISRCYLLIEWNYKNYKLEIHVSCLNLRDSSDDTTLICEVSTINCNSTVKISKSFQLHDTVIIDVQDLCKDELPIASFLSLSISASLSTSSMKKMEEDLTKIICPNCSFQIVPPVLKCSLGHITCMDCIETEFDYCVTCGNDQQRFSRVPELEALAVSSPYTCKWEGCEANFSIREIQAHQQVCSKRLYMCHHCQDMFGSISATVTHDAQCIDKMYPCPALIDTTVTVSGMSNELHYTLMAYNEIFWIRFQPENSYLRISICNYAPLSIWHWFRFEADLRHVSDCNCPFNKIYCIRTKVNEFFDVYIPVEHISRFGGLEFCKITVRIILLSDEDQKRSNVIPNVRYLL